MFVDALAKLLHELLEQGSVPASHISGRARRELVELFQAQVLVERRAGAGRRVLVAGQRGLESWIAGRYPHGLKGRRGLEGRARGVANLGDSKRGGSVDSALVHLRGFGEGRFFSEGEVFPVAELTTSFGAASLLVDEGCRWEFEGRLCMVENLEAFLYVEELVPDVDVAIYTQGRLPQLVLDWLERSQSGRGRVIHFGDYDPVGLDEYLRLSAALGEGVELFLPDELREMFARYGNAELLQVSRKVLNRVRRSEDPQVRRVVELFDEYGRGLEQEALLIDGGERR